MNSTEDIEAFLASQSSITEVLNLVAELSLPDCWVAAGFIRNAIWDSLAGVDPEHFDNSDIDVLYFDAATPSVEAEKAHEANLARKFPGPDWQVRNQARMHLRNGDAPYRDTAHAMCHWLETPTAIAARLVRGKVHVLAPLGVEDLLALTLRPTETGLRKLDQFEQRLRERNWQQRWPTMRVERPR